jgi:hypothetical protein
MRRGGQVDGDYAIASERRQRIFAVGACLREDVVANKEQKRSSREAKKPKQKKKGSQKQAASKVQIIKT